MNRRNMRCRKRKEREIGIDISFARSDENGLFWHLRTALKSEIFQVKTLLPEK